MVTGWDVELRCNEPCEVTRGMPRAQLRLEVERKKGVEHIVGQKQEKEEHEHGVGFVLVDVICVPLVHELVEPVVLDPPPGVSDTHNSLRSSYRFRHIRRPYPLRDRLRFFIGTPATHGGCFNGSNHPNRMVELLPGREPLYIPTLISSATYVLPIEWREWGRRISERQRIVD